MVEEDLTVRMAEGEMEIFGLKTKGFRLYSLTAVVLMGLLAAVFLKVDMAYIAILGTIASNLVGVFTGKKA